MNSTSELSLSRRGTNPAPSAGKAESVLKQLGPGLITGAADDDPSGIATYSQAGAQFGFNMLWTMLLTYPLMCAIQLISARIGRVTGCGLATNMGAIWPRPLVIGLVLLLFTANTINIGANLAAMGASAELATGVPSLPATMFFALLSLGLQMFIPYERYAQYLKWLTLVLLSYVAVLFVVEIDWLAALRGFVWPSFPLSGNSFTVVVAILGTTISPYLFFWQSSQEVEEIDRKDAAEPLKEAPQQAPKELKRIRLDTFAGMAVSNIVAIVIMMSTAATLHAHGKTEIGSAADVAEALKPVAGEFAFVLFSLGIIGTGMLSIPVLAGSAAYAFGESQDWKCGLEHKPWEAYGFYGVIAAATLLGLGIEFAPIDPIKALFWSAVINGFVAVPIMMAMMMVVSRRDRMKEFTASPTTLVFGWGATGVMAIAAIAMIIF
ncbi:NRAMP (natural resistance-associated macrophage protein)-like metal ion transporter [Pararhizobium capsulatum DSM 1112]|uniref:NRAMP (Natural resistance-associated macrophage protein)-like metal ion transporter n=1 Tax=Pararhizobium capsulatum DSM 1112 TaxID=1121113 RepID=A0ABU0BZ93_9HYPH|nr:Nramp family divalent metal transporter [Pararhizobium capsulatum]MDQ0323576.1 NRAMP (natural resistance-associated macrophage protein)-like metal ion transporter [Pararhizobium capsulatum DSM 1112]